MVRTLFIDATRGLSAASLLAALVDLGAAPSPVLHAVGGLALPVEMRMNTCADGTTVHLLPEHHGVLVRPRDVEALFERAGFPQGPARLASDAVGRYLLAAAAERRLEAACILQQEVDAGALLSIAGAAVALDALDVERVVCSPLGVADEMDAALVELLADDADALRFGEGDTRGDAAALLRSLGVECGKEEPSWQGVVSRGRSCGEPACQVALGEAQPGSTK